MISLHQSLKSLDLINIAALTNPTIQGCTSKTEVKILLNTL